MDLAKKALSLALCLLVGWNDIATAQGIHSGSETINLLSFYQKSLGISPKVAVITGAYNGRLESERTKTSFKTRHSKLPKFILIQDLHANQEAQERIANVIVHGFRHWNLRQVFIEGASARVDVSVLRTLPRKVQNNLLDNFLREGYLTGPEIAAVRLRGSWLDSPSFSSLQLQGLEDPEIYWKHLATYKQAKILERPALQELYSIQNLHSELCIAPVDPLAQQLKRTFHLVRLGLTPEELADYLRFKSQTAHTPKLGPALANAEAFYQLAKQRDEILLVRAKNMPVEGPRVMVIGGFHSYGIAEKLQQQGTSFVVLTPTIHRLDHEWRYRERMQELTDTLAFWHWLQGVVGRGHKSSAHIMQKVSHIHHLSVPQFRKNRFRLSWKAILTSTLLWVSLVMGSGFTGIMEELRSAPAQDTSTSETLLAQTQRSIKNRENIQYNLSQSSTDQEILNHLRKEFGQEFTPFVYQAQRQFVRHAERIIPPLSQEELNRIHMKTYRTTSWKTFLLHLRHYNNIDLFSRILLVISMLALLSIPIAMMRVPDLRDWRTFIVLVSLPLLFVFLIFMRYGGANVSGYSTPWGIHVKLGKTAELEATVVHETAHELFRIRGIPQDGPKGDKIHFYIHALGRLYAIEQTQKNNKPAPRAGPLIPGTVIATKAWQIGQDTKNPENAWNFLFDTIKLIAEGKETREAEKEAEARLRLTSSELPAKSSRAMSSLRTLRDGTSLIGYAFIFEMGLVAATKMFQVTMAFVQADPVMFLLVLFGSMTALTTTMFLFNGSQQTTKSDKPSVNLFGPVFKQTTIFLSAA